MITQNDADFVLDQAIASIIPYLSSRLGKEITPGTLKAAGWFFEAERLGLIKEGQGFEVHVKGQGFLIRPLTARKKLDKIEREAMSPAMLEAKRNREQLMKQLAALVEEIESCSVELETV